MASLLVGIPDADLPKISESLPKGGWEISQGVIVIRSTIGSSYLNTYIDEIWPTAAALFASLERYETEVESCILRLVEYLGKEEEQGGSFWLETQWMVELGKHRGELDVDIYVGPFPTSV